MTTNPDPNVRSIRLERVETGRYRATNAKGATIEYGSGEGLMSPVDLLMLAMGGCSAIDVDFPTSRRVEPEEFCVEVSGTHVEEDGAHRMDDFVMRWDVRFPEGEAGDKARAMLPQLVRQSHDRLCTVSITVSHGATVTNELP